MDGEENSEGYGLKTGTQVQNFLEESLWPGRMENPTRESREAAVPTEGEEAPLGPRRKKMLGRSVCFILST